MIFLKKIGWIFFILLSTSPLSAHPKETITLQVPDNFYGEVCPTPRWQGLKVDWQGVQDQRPEKLLGVVTKKKGRDPIQVFSQKPLSQVWDEALQKLLRQCGMTLVPANTPGAIPLKAVLETFEAREEKGLLTGKGSAKSRLLFQARMPTRKVMASVGYQLEFKQGRKRGIRRLQKVLEELFIETLKQVPSSSTLQGL